MPRDNDIRRVLKHPNGTRFRKDGSVEWPNDSFTKRRLAEGVITLEETPRDRDKHHRPRGQDPTSAA
ncbi:hypothetical protein [Bradyrhizobium neotropicale]|uniref:hypothetical protein n=1 Tax=Bradyrhizobium neotropicale TaxID=1497615 RepID=UPI001AD70323|nr:hypothetical protein [Bradyrhizobium neotropicale]MBO4221956.1 hypothetical protein [Bradyrhizobium neotropicale]